MTYALLVDDDPELVTSYRSFLSDLGLEIESAETWDEGLSRFLATSPELVIADYNLPGSRHGLRLLFDMARLKPTTRLVLLSAYVTEDDVAKIEEMGIADRALRKLDPVASGRAVRQEVEAARDRAATGAATDWRAFALAAQRNRAIADEDFERLDNFLRENRLPSGAGQ